MTNNKKRKERRHKATGDDQRAPFERDRDRILYSSAYQRLAGITQIVKVGEESVFHTRQQHSLKVAQVGRRLAQNCVRKNQKLANKLGGIDPEVVEAACLAHDLGHPPFGHAGEKELNKLTKDVGGYEGNAQTFRIITKISARFDRVRGLDLTRATLAACLKYPWIRDITDDNKKNKWSVYDTEKEDFQFAREHFAKKYYRRDAPTPEAKLMDWADDITYSIHDLEDFHRCGLIPWGEIIEDSESIIKAAADNWPGTLSHAKRINILENAHEEFKNIIFFYSKIHEETYDGSYGQRQQFRNFASALIGNAIRRCKLVNFDEDPSGVKIEEESEALVRFLKQVTRDYVISTPALIAQQIGYRKIISELFSKIKEDSKKDGPSFLPKRMEYLKEIDRKFKPARFAADCISVLTEREAIALHGRLFGHESGSVLDPLVR